MKKNIITDATEYVVFDLEWNRPTTRYRAKNNGVKLKGEIIQIGAIKLNQKLEVIDEFDIYVKPQVYHKMLKEITQITDITNDMLNEGVPFQQAVKMFLDWCGEDYVFCSWSANDILRLEENMLYYNMEIDDLPECYDMQYMFDDQITMDGRDFALSYAMWKLNIKPKRAHSALNDAINTASVMRFLDFSSGLEAYAV